ncbi:hypothetical protein CBR_g78217, partial [Chara braunii]
EMYVRNAYEINIRNMQRNAGGPGPAGPAGAAGRAGAAGAAGAAGGGGVGGPGGAGGGAGGAGQEASGPGASASVGRSTATGMGRRRRAREQGDDDRPRKHLSGSRQICQALLYCTDRIVAVARRGNELMERMVALEERRLEFEMANSARMLDIFERMAEKL